jgi:phenylacetate-CoA ligase
MNSMPLDLPHLGDPQQADAIARKAADKVPAYHAFLGDPANSPKWETRPLTSKKEYLLHYPYADLLAHNYHECFAIFSSSGSSGRAFYWPQLREGNNDTLQRLRSFLENTFQIHQKKTLAVIGLALGSWIGGEHFSWALKNVSVSSPYPFSTFSPGNSHDEIIDMIHSVDGFVDQVILMLCPSAIGHLRLRAEEQGRPLPMHKLRFLVVGEPFPETLRSELTQTCGDCAAPILSIYGSADTGVLGFESPLSAMIRAQLTQAPAIAQSLGFAHSVPHLFHQANADVFLESIHGELCVTKWQGIPLVRYNLHDAARLISWQALATCVAEQFPEDSCERAQLLASALTLPDLIAIEGRADSCLLLCGTNLTEAMLDNAIHAPELKEFLSGNYRAQSIQQDNRQRLELTLEYKDPAADTHELSERIYPRLISAIGRAQPEFLQDWENIYKRWDNDPDKRILKLKMVSWPQLSQTNSIKQRGINA